MCARCLRAEAQHKKEAGKQETKEPEKHKKKTTRTLGRLMSSQTAVPMLFSCLFTFLRIPFQIDIRIHTRCTHPSRI